MAEVCKIAENAKKGVYDDNIWIIEQLCSGDCENCPHLIKKVEQ